MILPRSCLILTGPIGSGKTSAMRSIFEGLAADGRRLSAVLQPDEGRRPDGAAIAFAMEYLRAAGGRLAAERASLARELEPGELPTAGYLALGRFVFDRSAFARAEEFLREAVTAKNRVECLGLDEIGRLELQRGEGLMPSLELALAWAADQAGARVLVCSVREDCVVEARRLAQVAGLMAEAFEVSRAEEALSAARRALGR